MKVNYIVATRDKHGNKGLFGVDHVDDEKQAREVVMATFPDINVALVGMTFTPEEMEDAA